MNDCMKILIMIKQDKVLIALFKLGPSLPI